ncbi:MAG TPA: NADH-quinone oxidoreductase subunit NuoG [Acidimicrobiales bacterium]|nr:NADH-quinone oxidoreductase subunit NuoG [Acidimicrobiales bacterium]
MADTGQAEQEKTTVTITLDGKEIEANPGEMVIAAAERHGVYIPRFCYHPRMRPVGMCRMCIVEIDSGRGPALQPSCMIPVADGMKIDAASARTKKAQDGVLEFLLINHPLDCPVCDKGGECPLQDQTLAFGPGESRFVEEKRHFEKPIPISDLVYLDRERCVLCDRCTRFAKEVAGDPLISFIDRGNHTQVNTFPDDPFASYFSGNTVQLCPVGALLARPYRFRARPWDLDQVESTCTACAFGCRVALQSSANRLVRKLGVDVDPVNWGWMCDKGRFDFEAVNSDDRLGTPLVRAAGADGAVEGSPTDLAPASWSEAWDRILEAVSRSRLRPGPESITVLGGARLTNEDAYAWSKLARTVLVTDAVDAQLGDGLPAEMVLGLPRASIDAACAADTVVLLGPDLKEELPVLYLRLRQAVVERGLNLVEVSPVATGMTPYAAVSLRYRPGEAAETMRALVADDDGAGTDGQSEALGRARQLLRAGSLVCVLGRPSLAEPAQPIVSAAAALLEAVPATTFLSALRRANVQGALDMGLAPGVLPGRVSLDEGRRWFTQAWGTLPTAAGLDAHGILTAAAEGRVACLILLGADPLADFPDRSLARRALAGAGFVLAVDGHLTASARRADVVLPAAIYGEKGGTTTNLEGRVSRLHQKITAPGTARADWMIAVELASRLGADLGFASEAEVWDEIERVAPSHRGLTRARLASAEGFDGLLAGGVPEESDRNAPPTMSQADAPGVQGSLGHTKDDIGATTGMGQNAHPDPRSGDESAGAPPELAGAEAAAGAGGSGYADGDTPEGAGRQAHAVEQSVRGEGGQGRSSFRPSGGGADGGTTANAPSVLSWSSSSPAPPLPPIDRYSLRLISVRKLYDDGTLVHHSPSLAPLAPGARIRVNPADLAPLGVASGTKLQVSSSQGRVVLEAVTDMAVPQGSAVVVFNQPGPGAADLIDAGAPVTEVRIQTLSGSSGATP